MAATQDLRQDASGDLDVSTGDLRRTETAAELAANGLSQNLQFWQGEWYLDLRLGFPYFTRVFGQKFDRAALSSLYRQAAGKTLAVGSVDAVTLAFDGPSRELTGRLQVRASDGSPVEVGPFIIGEAA